MANVVYSPEEEAEIRKALTYHHADGLRLTSNKRLVNGQQYVLRIAETKVQMILPPRRVAWFLATGKWPEGVVRCVGQPNDLRAHNLRNKGVLLSTVLGLNIADPKAIVATTHVTTPDPIIDIKVMRRAIEALTQEHDEAAKAHDEAILKLRREVHQLTELIRSLCTELGVKQAG